MSKKEKAAKVLREARKIMASKERWCQGSWAKDVDGCELKGDRYVEANSPQAVRWCVEGAIYKAAKNIRALDRTVADSTGFSQAMGLNDSNGDASRKQLCKCLTQTANALEKEIA